MGPRRPQAASRALTTSLQPREKGVGENGHKTDCGHPTSEAWQAGAEAVASPHAGAGGQRASPSPPLPSPQRTSPPVAGPRRGASRTAVSGPGERAESARGHPPPHPPARPQPRSAPGSGDRGTGRKLPRGPAISRDLAGRPRAGVPEAEVKRLSACGPSGCYRVLLK